MSTASWQSKDEEKLLRAVARLWGVSPPYKGQRGELRVVESAALARMLEMVTGRSVRARADLHALVSLRHEQRLARMLEPVLVAWDGKLPFVKVTLTEDEATAPLRFEFQSEDATTRSVSFILNAQTQRRTTKLASGQTAVEHVLPFAPQCALGYHHLTVRSGSRVAKALVIAAPRRISPSRGQTQAAWGLFTPLYALRSANDWGAGSFSELTAALDFVASRGGSFVGTLPLLATHDYRSPSPYAPSSRLFWNELYLDVEAIAANLADAPTRAFLRDPAFQRRKEDLRRGSHVDYVGVYELKKQVLTRLCQTFFAAGHDTGEAYRAFLAEFPDVVSYAAFKAQGDAAVERYHLFVQFQAYCALRRLAERGEEGHGLGLYIDFPIGVEPQGFDCQHYKEHFLSGFTVGAPPDAFFPKGQNWGFLPLHPQAMREEGYDYFIKCVRRHVRFAKILRFDHVMGLHRLYVIPDGQETSKGAYLRYPRDELYAILCLEAERRGCTIVGEDLGTVPAGVPRALAEHGLSGMWVFQYSATTEPPATTLAKIPANAMACVNTHDMPTFKAFWQGADLELNFKLGLAEENYIEGLATERKGILSTWRSHLLPKPKTDDPIAATYASVIVELARSQAPMLALNIEDLWQETEPQNVPGTTDEYPNWRKKHRLSLDEWMQAADVAKLLQSVSTARARTTGGHCGEEGL